MITFQRSCFNIGQNYINITFLKQSKQILSNLYLFCVDQKKGFDIQQQRKILYDLCMLSNKVIEIIRKKQKQHLLNYSLRDKILYQIGQEQIFNHKKAKEEIKKLFVEGIQMDQKKLQIFSQTRITETMVNRDTPGLLIKTKRITFFPTYFVTSKMFDLIQQYLLCNRLIKGHLGFAKTFSMILYCQLTNNIINYRLKYPNQSQKLPEQIKKRPKVFYWTIDTYFKKNKLFNFIQNNCQQVQHLLKEIPQILKTDKQFYLQILSKYDQNKIPLALFWDQINKLVSILRKRNYSIFLNKQQIASIQRDYNFYRKFTYYNESILGYFKTKIGLSSVTIQDHIVQQLNLTGQDQHRTVSQTNLNLLKKINQDQTIYELVDFFIFQCGQYIKFKKLDENWNKRYQEKDQLYFKQIRKSLFSYLKNKKGVYFLNHLSINQYLNNKDLKVNNEQKSQLPAFFILQMNKCLNNSLNIFSTKLNFFIQKDSNFKYARNIKIRFLTQVYLKSLILVLKGNPEEYLSPITVQKIDQNESLSIEMFHTELFQVQQILFNQVFQIQCYCCSGILVQLLKKVLDEQLGSKSRIDNPSDVMHYFFSLFKNNQLRTHFQTILINCLLLKGTQFIIKSQKNQKKYEFYKKFANTFKSVPTNRQSKIQENQNKQINKSIYCIINELEYSIAELINIKQKNKILNQLNHPNIQKSKNSNLSIVCLPRFQNQQKTDIIPNQRKSNNKVFDLIIINQSQEKNENQKRKIQILAIDTTVSQTKSKIQQKIKKFLLTFQTFKQHQTNIININYLKNNQTISEQIEVQFKFCVIGCKNQKIDQQQSIISQLSSFKKLKNKQVKLTKTINIKIQEHPILTQIQIINIDQFELKHLPATHFQQRFLKIISKQLFGKLQQKDKKTLQKKLFIKKITDNNTL